MGSARWACRTACLLSAAYHGLQHAWPCAKPERTSTPSDSSWSATVRPVPSSSSSSSSGIVGVSGCVGRTLSSGTGTCQWAMHRVSVRRTAAKLGCSTGRERGTVCCWLGCSPCGLSLLPLWLCGHLRVREGQCVRSLGRHREGDGGDGAITKCKRLITRDL